MNCHSNARKIYSGTKGARTNHDAETSWKDRVRDCWYVVELLIGDPGQVCLFTSFFFEAARVDEGFYRKASIGESSIRRCVDGRQSFVETNGFCAGQGKDNDSIDCGQRL